MANIDVQYVYPPSNSFFCPVCQDVYTDPVITRACNHSFCYACLFQSLENESLCPLCRGYIHSEELHPNLALSNLIGELMVYCGYREHGCLQTMRKDDLVAHMAQCEYKPVICDHASLGCEYKGVAAFMPEHLNHCVYEQLKPLISSMSARIDLLEERLQKQHNELEMLHALLRENGTSAPMSPQPSSPALSMSMKKTISEEGMASTRTLSSRAVSPELRHSLSYDTLHHPTRTTTDTQSSWVHGDIICRRTFSHHTSGVTSVCYGQDTLFTAMHDGSIEVLDLKNTERKTFLHEHRMSVWALALHSNLNRLFSAGRDGTLKAWDLSKYMTSESVDIPPLATLSSEHGKIYSLVVMGDRLFSGSSDKTIKVWDANTFENLATFTGHTNNINSITVLQDNHIVTASSDRTLKIWDTVTGQCTRTIPTQAEALDCAYGDGLLFASTYDALIHAYSLEDTRSLARLDGHNWEVWQLAYAGQYGRQGAASSALGSGTGLAGKLFSGSFDHTIRRWDTRMWSCDLVLRGHKGYVHAMTLGDGCLISGCADKTVKMWW
ncbi:WD40-repeat-containing domain protein [Syncephalis plumigaleata]|nr:WD40-repeat-containing domain protein [Syncephalis plumigaleata]